MEKLYNQAPLVSGVHGYVLLQRSAILRLAESRIRGWQSSVDMIERPKSLSASHVTRGVQTDHECNFKITNSGAFAWLCFVHP